MGASEWHARVPYQDDIGAALQQARWDAYNRRDYYFVPPSEVVGTMDEEQYVAWGIEQTKASVPEELAGVDWSGDQYRDEWRAAQVVVTDPDSLLESQPFSGTHCVIDMTHVAGEPGYNAVAPAPDEYLVELFGTTKPTPEAVEAVIEAHNLDGFGRWHGLYLIAYTDGKPDAIFFAGHSGD